MSQSTFFIVILIIAAVAFWALVFGGRLPVPFRMRACQGREWRRTFNDVPNHEIREFLSLFVSAFALNDKEKLKLNPNDQILDIYRSLYPHKWQADALELETLAKAIAIKYGVSLEGIWNEHLTLGKLFFCIRKELSVS